MRSVGMKSVGQEGSRNNIKQLQSLSINTEQVIRRVNLILISWHGTNTEIYLYTTHTIILTTNHTVCNSRPLHTQYARDIFIKVTSSKNENPRHLQVGEGGVVGYCDVRSVRF